MDLIVSGKNFRLTPSLKNYVEQKVGRLSRFWRRIIRARVELDVDHNQKSGDIYRVEAKVEVPGPDIRLGIKARDMHAAVDLIVPKLERLIGKAKAKIDSRGRRSRPRDSSSGLV
ncbi:MAG: ribosome-associated translation inhibitor RaiA [Candidatus Kerfeldbacteria bacterium]|nr:ribosome-associated translation inhibitor RaiA [Candidatus Kerfeldbacteria bacterium]